MKGEQDKYMKRLVTYKIENDKKKVISISAPIDESNIKDDSYLNSNCGYIDANFNEPTPIENKKTTLYYNSDTQMIEVEYSDITFSDLTPIEKINSLKKENETLLNENTSLKEIINSLKEELELTQLALFEVDAKIESNTSTTNE